MAEVVTYTVKLIKPKSITLEYVHHTIQVNNLKMVDYILEDVKQDEMYELFKSGIVLSAVKNLPEGGK